MLREFRNAADLGGACRQARRRLKLNLEEAALAAGVNYRFASELENGKSTAQIDLALRYATTLGLTLFCELHADGKGASSPAAASRP